MNSLKYYSVLGLIFFGVLALSFSTLTTKPQIWVDEAKSIELARNFMNFGKLNIQTAPGEFTGFPEILQSTGYPVTVPLAIFFKIFGYGLVQARIYMLGWMLAALSAVFIIGRRFFGDYSAIFAVLLIASFASFYDSGRTVVGEIPGFVFLLIGFYFWLDRSEYFWTGFWWSLSIVSKPSVFTWIIPTLVLILLFKRKDFLKNIFLTGFGMLPAAMGWILLVLGNPFIKASWINILNFYKNPYQSVSLSENAVSNLSQVLQSTTLVYFGGLLILLLMGWYWNEEEKLRKLYQFAVFYSAFAFIYYLMSPGWLRYILISELLILFLLPDAAGKAAKFFKDFSLRLPILILASLFIIQFVHLFTAADIFYSNSAILASELLNREFPDKSIGVINSSALSVLLNTNKRFQFVEMTGLPMIGENPLFSDPRPEVMAFWPGEKLSAESQLILENYYLPYSKAGGYLIYLLR